MDNWLKRPEEQYRRDTCDACGECLSHCPYIKLSRAGAAREMRLMREGRHSVVLDRCIGCWTCDATCPNGNRPYTLIRTRWYQRYQVCGLPARARNLMPTVFPNFRTGVNFSPEEKRMLKGYAMPPNTDTILYTGCNSLVFPKELQASVFRGLEPFGSFRYCCGEMYYRMGLFDTARDTALKLKGIFDMADAKKVVFTCSACMNMISNVYPREFGIDFDFEKQFISSWWLDRIEKGKMEFVAQLDEKVTVQDSCHAKMMGPEIHGGPRKLLEMAGAEVVEMKHAKKESLCCGIAGGCANLRVRDIAISGMRRLEETRRSNANSTMAYCTGCRLTMAMMRVFYPAAPRVRSLAHYVRLATGESDPPDYIDKRARQVLAGIAVNAAPYLLHPGRFYVDPVK